MLDEVLDTILPTTQVPIIEFTDTAAVTDESLVRSVLDGDERAFADIFEKYRRQMTRTVSRFFREKTDIEECVQICFTKVYFSLGKYRGGEENSFPVWLTRIAVNVCYDELRRRQRKPENLFAEMSTEEHDYVEAVIDGREVSFDRKLVAAQLVEKMLSGLDPRDRIAMTMIYSQDYSLTEAADAIGITTSNLKSRLFRCRNRIKDKFNHLF